jgi:hypothetical protein
MPNLNQKKAIIIDFLNKCNIYSEQMLKRYEQQLADANGADRALTQKKIENWISYREFNEYTITELNTDELDDWFGPEK